MCNSVAPGLQLSDWAAVVLPGSAATEEAATIPLTRQAGHGPPQKALGLFMEEGKVN